jgi:hypothetical protein
MAAKPPPRTWPVAGDLITRLASAPIHPAPIHPALGAFINGFEPARTTDGGL